MSRRRRAAPARLVLYTSRECGLCERAREVLRRLDLFYEEVEVPDDHAYRVRTPVLEADGRVVAEGLLDDSRVARAVGG